MRRALQLGLPVGIGVLVLLLAHPLAAAASDTWSNVAPASPLAGGGLFGRYPLDHYGLDQHFTVVDASLTGVDVSGVPPMIAFFLASIIWALTSFMANALISLFSFAFSLDLLNGSPETGGAGALAPVSAAIHSIYTSAFGGPWFVLAITVVGIWAMWKALVQRRYAETAGALGLSLIYVVLALFFVFQPAATIGSASKWTNEMSVGFLSLADRGEPTGGEEAKQDVADELHKLLVLNPWVVLNFGGLEHCAVAGTGGEDEDPESVAVRPLSSNPDRDAQLARALRRGTEVTADGKTCVNNSNKYAHHFLRFGIGTDERDDEYDALNHGDASKLPDADPAAAGYRLGVADKPATDAMEEGGQYQRLLMAIVVFVGALGAFCLLGSLSVGIILAQILLLLLLAFAPVALVAAVIPGRGHAFFKGWLEKLAGYLLRKAAYSLILAVLLAVNGALAAATSQLGWLMSFGLQSLFFWAVFLQRKNLADSLIGIATGPGAPGRDSSARLLALYAGARTVGRPLRGLRRSSTPVAAGGGGGGHGRGGPGAPAPRFGTSYSAPVGGGYPALESPGPSTERVPSSPPVRADRRETSGTAGGGSAIPPTPAPAQSKRDRAPDPAPRKKKQRSPSIAEAEPAGKHRSTERQQGRPDRAPAGPGAARVDEEAGSRSDLSAELASERERSKPGPAPAPPPPAAEASANEAPTAPPRRRRRRKGRRK